MEKLRGLSPAAGGLERFALVLTTCAFVACADGSGRPGQPGNGGTTGQGGSTSGGAGTSGPAGVAGGAGTAGPAGNAGTTGGAGLSGVAGTTGTGGTAGTGGTGTGGAGGSGTTGTGGAAGSHPPIGGTGGAGGTASLPQDEPGFTFTDSDFQIVTAPEKVAGALALDIAPDERAFVGLRKGQIKIWKPDNTMVTAGMLSVYSGLEDGLIGLAVDPGFATNHFIYIYYSASSESFQHLSRFTVNGDTIDMASEKILLKVPDDRATGVCHTGGGMEFDWQGNLWLGIGDGTNPYESDGYAPLNEGTPSQDSERSAGNSKDFRGSILRITPKADGTYSVPAGNLFTNAADGLPEIFVKGTRNSYRIAVDKAHNWVYWGDIGPDAGGANSSRGPRGYDEFNQAKTAGYYGWPFCIADNKAYNAYNFSTGTSGALADCAGGPANNSRNNTGLKKLPPAQPAWMFYHPDAGSNPLDSADRGGRTALGGDVYNWRAGGSPKKLPRALDGHVFLMEFSRKWVRDVTVSSTGAYMSNKKFLSSLRSDWGPVLNMRISPSGVMYISQYGGIDTYAGSSPDPQSLFRVEFIGQAGRQPIAVIGATPTSGPTPLAVTFSSAGSKDPANMAITYAWDFDGNGTTDSTVANPSYTYTTGGAFKAKLTVRNAAGLTASAIIDIVAGNTRPVVTVASPPAGGFVGANELVDYTVSVTDAEDGTVACTSVSGELQLAHDEHVHPGLPQFGCTGSLRTASAIIPEENAWHQIFAAYDDMGGANGAPSLSGGKAVTLNFKRMEAEHFGVRGMATNVVAATSTDTMGGYQQVGSIRDGSSICWNEMNFQGINSLSYRVIGGTGGRIELHQDSTTGTMLSTVNIPAGGSWANVPATLSASTGTHKTCFVFRGSSATATNLFTLNWIDFLGAGVSHP